MGKNTNSPVMIVRKNNIINSALYHEVLDRALDNVIRDLPKYSKLLYYYSIHIICKTYDEVISMDPSIDIDNYVFSFDLEEFNNLNKIGENNHSYKSELKKSSAITGKLFLEFFMDNGESVGVIPHYTYWFFDGVNNRIDFMVRKSVFDFYAKGNNPEDIHTVDIASCFSFNNIKGAVELYMFICGISSLPEYKNNPKQFVELPLLLKVMRIKGYKDNYSGFKRKKLDPSVEVINNGTDISFQYSEEKDISGEVIGIWIINVKRKTGTIEVGADNEVAVEEEDIAVAKISDKVGFSNEESFRLFRLSGYNFRIFKKVAEMYEYVKLNDLMPLDDKDSIYGFFERQIIKLRDSAK